MTTSADEILSVLRARIEGRVREQLARHATIDPEVDPRKVVAIQMKQEREKLERLIEENEDNAQLADAYQALLDEWLPTLEQKLKGR